MAEIVYNPTDLIFHIVEGKDKEHMPEPLVYFTTKEDWAEKKGMSYHLGGHNMPVYYLNLCGINEYEEMESIFAFLPGEKIDEVETMMLCVGFNKDQEFSDHVMRQYNSEYE